MKDPPIPSGGAGSCIRSVGKWLSALLLLIALVPSLFVAGLVVATDEGRMVDALSASFGLVFTVVPVAGGTLDAAHLRETLSAGTLAPGHPVRTAVERVLAEPGVDELGPEALRLRMGRQFAIPLYREGVAGLASLSADPGGGRSLLANPGVFALFTHAFHQRLVDLALAFAALSVSLLIGLVVSCAGFGRLGAPGLVLFLAAFPGWLLFSLGGFVAQLALAMVPLGRDVDAAALLRVAIAPAIEAMAETHLAALVVGVVVVGLALFGGWFAPHQRPQGP